MDALEKKQIRLLQQVRKIRLKQVPLRPTAARINYLKNFFLSRQARRSLLLSSALLLQSVAEIVLVIISHNYLKSNPQLQGLINQNNLFVLILSGAALYLGASFIAIKSERTLIIQLINELRAQWFALSLSDKNPDLNLEKKASLLAKVAYHLPLLSTGLGNSLAGLVRWSLLALILTFLSLIFNLKFLPIAVAAVVLSGLIGAIAFYISRNYVARETTFFSKIIKAIDLTLSDHHFTKSLGRTREAEEDLQELVDLDSYFRVRRDLWLRFSGSLVFILLIFLSWLSSLFYQPLSVWLTVKADNRFILIIFFIYFSRLFYEGLRIGLYSVPLCLGITLGIPEKKAPRRPKYKKLHFPIISFNLKKARLFKNSPYYKDLSFSFQRGGRYLISTGVRRGKTILAKLLVGSGHYAHRAWIIKTQEKRYFYNDFFATYADFYYIDPHFTSNRSLLEVTLGKEKTRISNQDLADLSALIDSQPELRDIFFEQEDWRLKASKLANNAKNVLLPQIIHCLVKQPFLITVDNYWLDRHDPEIDSLLRLLADRLPNSIIVFFASAHNELLPYQEHYEI